VILLKHFHVFAPLPAKWHGAARGRLSLADVRMKTGGSGEDFAQLQVLLMDNILQWMPDPWRAVLQANGSFSVNTDA
jgi:hypothetical protein